MDYTINAHFEELFEARSVGALLTVGEGHYLMQLRDNQPHVGMAGNWGLFGGWVEPGESVEDSLIRELMEELEFKAENFSRFTETAYLVPWKNIGPTHKTFFHIPIEKKDIEVMVQHEGADMKVFTLAQLQTMPNTLPWDLCAVHCHARRQEIFKLHENWEK